MFMRDRLEVLPLKPASLVVALDHAILDPMRLPLQLARIFLGVQLPLYAF